MMITFELFRKEPPLSGAWWQRSPNLTPQEKKEPNTSVFLNNKPLLKWGIPFSDAPISQVPGYTRPLPLPQGCKCLAAAAWNPVCHCWLPPWTLRTGRTRFCFKNGGQKSTRWLSFPEMIWYCKSHRWGDRTSSNPFCWGIEMEFVIGGSVDNISRCMMTYEDMMIYDDILRKLQF